MVQITVCGRRQFQRAEADVVKGFIVDTESFVGVLDQLMDGERRVVRLYDRVGNLNLNWHLISNSKQTQTYIEGSMYLWRREHGKCVHNTIWILLADFGQQKCAHSGSSAATQRVGQLESLQRVAGFRLFTYDVEHRLDEFSALGVVALGPVVAGARLTVHKAVRSEQLAVR